MYSLDLNVTINSQIVISILPDIEPKSKHSLQLVLIFAGSRNNHTHRTTVSLIKLLILFKSTRHWINRIIHIFISQQCAYKMDLKSGVSDE